jgi:hypothetical protein
MNKCEVAEFFGVSRVTVNNWCRRGCPIGSDGQMEAGAIAEWKARRDLKDSGFGGGNFPRLMGELYRRLFGLEDPIKWVNEMPVDAQGEPGLIKAAIVHGLVLERALLRLPLDVLNDSRPGTFPEVLMRNLFEKLDAIKGGEEEEDHGELA